MVPARDAEGAEPDDLHPRGRADDPRGLGAVPRGGALDGRPPRPPDRARRLAGRPGRRPLGDIRSLRRWLLVTARVGGGGDRDRVIALIQANKDDTSRPDRSPPPTWRASQKRPQRPHRRPRRPQVDELPTSDDLAKLDSRIKDVETKADKRAARTRQAERPRRRPGEAGRRPRAAAEPDARRTRRPLRNKERGAPAGRPSRCLLDSTGFASCDRRDQPRPELPTVSRVGLR